MKHISEINLQRLLDDNLSLVQKLICKHHLAKCDECAAKLEAVKTQRQQLLSIAGDTSPRSANAQSAKQQHTRRVTHRREAASHGVRNHAVTPGKRPERRAAWGRTSLMNSARKSATIHP